MARPQCVTSSDDVTALYRLPAPYAPPPCHALPRTHVILPLTMVVQKHSQADHECNNSLAAGSHNVYKNFSNSYE